MPAVAADDVRDEVLVVLKAVLSESPASIFAPGGLSVREAFEVFAEKPAKSVHEQRVAEQILREFSAASHDFITISPSGEIAKVDGEAVLNDLAVAREIKTTQGGSMRRIPTVAVEIQAYAPVGSSPHDALDT